MEKGFIKYSLIKNSDLIEICLLKDLLYKSGGLAISGALSTLLGDSRKAFYGFRNCTEEGTVTGQVGDGEWVG